MMKQGEAAAVSRNTQIMREEVVGGGRLRYLLTRSDTQIGGVPVCVYGVAVMSALFGGEETAAVSDVTSLFEQAELLFEMLVRNIVLPCTLRDVVADFIAY